MTAGQTALADPAGGSLREHQVHERAWVVVVSGEVAIFVERDRGARERMLGD